MWGGSAECNGETALAGRRWRSLPGSMTLDPCQTPNRERKQEKRVLERSRRRRRSRLRGVKCCLSIKLEHRKGIAEPESPQSKQSKRDRESL